MSLDFSKIENYWKEYWVEKNVYKVDIDKSKPKFYVLDMFPYPSGAGLHVGHPLGYIASDIFSRYKKMTGFNVLHPMGFDSFGLPAEQYAIQTGIHPADSTRVNIKMYKKQLSNLGLNYDWSREVQTSDPKYYKWTQWIFSKLFEHYYDLDQQKAVPIDVLLDEFNKNGNKNIKSANSESSNFDASQWKEMPDIRKNEILMNYRLAYRKVSYVNWCEALGTVLANDEVKDGISERGGHPVIKKTMNQWSLRITAYAERLLNDMNDIEWSDSLKSMQKNWIGRSEGLQMFFDIDGSEDKLEIYTTRPDTIFGVTFMVMSPEHPFVKRLTTDENKENIERYIEYAVNKSEIERTSEKKITGAFTGSYAINPLNGKKFPIWISEYVLMDYGTGAIMAVPSDDERDRAFAEKFEIPIVDIIDKSSFPDATSKDKVGIMINSDFITGLKVTDAIETIINRVESMNIGRGQVNYKLRDANYSRQRYWGEPFPILYDNEGIAYLLPEDELPVELPEMTEFKPTVDGKSPLARNSSWVDSFDGFSRETDTMPGFAGSSWYFLRYMDPENELEFASKEALEYWQDVDFYIGGTEHAVGHLMYSRFWHKFLFDLVLVPTNEPFKRLVNQGMIQGVIEFLFLKKEKDNGINVFVTKENVSNNEIEDFAKIPVYIKFVKNYGSDDSYLDIKGIDEFRNWRAEYSNAKFILENGIYQDGKYIGSGVKEELRFTTISEVGKMSKRYHNVVNPDDVVDKYGADTFRMYEMFLGPIEQSKPWDTKGIDGVSKFIKRFWGLYVDMEGNWLLNEDKASNEEMKLLHKTIKKVTEDIKNLSFNTAISAMMVFVNEMRKIGTHKKDILIPMIKLIAPFAPFVSEELWSKSSNSGSVHHTEFPIFDEKYLKESSIKYPVCINGKKRGIEEFDANSTNDDIEKIVIELDYVKKWIGDKKIRKVIVVKGRMVNIVI